MSTEYQPLDADTSPAVELQSAAVAETASQQVAAEPAEAPPAEEKEQKPAEEKKLAEEKKPAEEKLTKEPTKEEKKDVAVNVGKGGYVPPGKPLRKFNRCTKGWVTLSFPILLVHLGICLIYIGTTHSFVADSFDNAGEGIQYLVTAVVTQDAMGLAYEYDTSGAGNYTGVFGRMKPGDANWSCANYPSGPYSISTKGLLAATMSCATLLAWSGQPMLDDFPESKGSNIKLAPGDYAKFEIDSSSWMSSSLCQTFTPLNDYDAYAYDYLLDAIQNCEIANYIVPTTVQEWDPERQQFKRQAVKKPKELASKMIYVYFFPMAAFVVVMALYNYRYFRPWIQFVEPYSSAELLKIMFRGQLDGLFMASYQWNDHPSLDQTQMKLPENQKFQGALPRKIATMLPHSWLDIENLIPGTQIKPACNGAAKNAKFTFGFISADYFKSANCGVEWTEIERRPGECILFAYPSTPQDKLDALAAQGHKIYKIQDVFDKMTPEWILENMISSRQANFLFATKTPPINQRWLSTLRYYFPTPDWQWLKFPAPILLTYLLLLGWHIGWSAHYRIFDLYPGEGDVATLGIFCFFIPFIGLIITLYFMVMTYGTGFAHHTLPDACLLLYFLKKLDIIPTVKFYTNCLADADPEIKTLADLGVIKFVDDIMEADVRLINIDKLDDLPTPRNTDAIWASVGFMQLPQSVRDKIGSFIIGEKIPSCQIEFLAVKILMAGFNCPSTDSLDIGAHGFRHLQLKRVLE